MTNPEAVALQRTWWIHIGLLLFTHVQHSTSCWKPHRARSSRAWGRIRSRSVWTNKEKENHDVRNTLRNLVCREMNRTNTRFIPPARAHTHFTSLFIFSSIKNNTKGSGWSRNLTLIRFSLSVFNTHNLPGVATHTHTHTGGYRSTVTWSFLPTTENHMLQPLFSAVQTSSHWDVRTGTHTNADTFFYPGERFNLLTCTDKSQTS